MPDPKPRKLIRSYRLVFHRRWRIFRIQGWRIPLPGGLELRLLAWRLRPRQLAALRRCPRPGTELAPLGELSLGPDLTSARYPRGRVAGPARLLLRYPVAVEATSSHLWRRGAARTWRLRPLDRPPLQSGKTIEVAPGATIRLEGARR